MNKRKKVSILYFLEQSIKSLWRNGVMTFASIAVLLSCLLVLGSFVLLLVNVNYNVQNIGMLNYILVFVDTDRDPSLLTEEVDDAFTIDQASPETTASGSIVENGGSAETASDSGNAGQSESSLVRVRGLWDDMSDADIASLGSKYDGEEITSLQSGVLSSTEELVNFTDLSKARTEVEDLRERFASVKARKAELGGDALGVYNDTETELTNIYKRITSLNDIELAIRQLDNVDTVKFTSKAQALAEMNEKYAEYTDLFDRLKSGDNPLTDQFTITYKDNTGVNELKTSLEHMTGMIYKINCQVEIANTIENVRSGIVFVFVWFLVILIVVSMFVIINTIKLAVFSRRQEIMVMRYVGATNAFITTPFVFEGVLIGLVASIAAYIVQYYTYMYIHNTVLTKFPFISVVDFGSFGGILLVGFLGLGILTGIIGSVISLHKYLRA